MIALHGSVDDSQFLLWGERSHDAEVRAHAQGGQTRRRRAVTARGHVRPFAYDAGIEPLAAALAEVRIDLSDDECQSAVAIGWFPTLGDTPLASSPLIAELPVSRAQTILRPWSVTTLGLSPDSTIDLLCACVGKQTLAPGIVIGKDLEYWATAMRFAGGMVARQQWLPDLDAIYLPRSNRLPTRAEGSLYRARWRAVFDGAYRSRLTQLAKAMPHACRGTLHGWA